ncbi:hypothetical protein [Sulfuriflexus mobilis]|uniref:hypothetical protein n=1 Tax=Sulfuriflexus mobilis TaxID=1811807 RepID=UPI000F84BF55|nr:hypothetical protein [Sulfuriflexus mobilis]
MSSGIDLKGLAIPAQKRPNKASFDARPRFIEAWTANLPMANLGETSRRVFKAMIEINRLQLPIEDRYRSLEALCEPCQHVTASLEKHFIGRPLPLNKKNRKISELDRALMSELALGYKIVARQLVEESARPDQKLLLNALQRATFYLGLLLLRSYQVYAPYPRNVWRELHSIYRYAEHHKLLDKISKSPVSPELGHNNTINFLYSKVQLLALAMPYRLHRGEVEKVCVLLNQLVPLVSPQTIPLQQDSQGLFIIDLNSDRQASYLALYPGQNYQDCRLLNTHALVMNLRQRLADKEPALLDILSEDLIQRLLASWSIMSTRSFSRISKWSEQVEVAFGLSAAHYFVSGEKPFSFDDTTRDELSIHDDHTSSFNTTKVNAISDQYTGPDVWTTNYTYSGNDPHNAVADTYALNNTARHIQSLGFQSSQLTVNNASAGGYCLLSQPNGNISVHIGDLLTIRESNGKSIEQWAIGVVRRMISTRHGCLELGVQMLTPNALAVAARVEAYNGRACNSEFMRCLMLPELGAIEQPATLITPALPFKKGSQIRISLDDKQVIATLTRQMETTRSFSQFEFSVREAEQAIAPVRVTKGEIHSRANFDSLWSTL